MEKLWRRPESNRRPRAGNLLFYMLSRLVTFNRLLLMRFVIPDCLKQFQR